MIRTNLNTVYHTYHEVKVAELYINVYRKDITEQKDANAYSSLLIFSGFDTRKADELFKKLKETGIVTYDEVVDANSIYGRYVGWVM